MTSTPIDGALAIGGAALPDRPAKRLRRGSLLGGFIALSMLVHGTLLLLPTQPRPLPREAGGPAALQVNMVSGSSMEPVTADREPIAKPQRAAPTPSARMARRVQPTVEPKRPAARRHSHSSPAPRPKTELKPQPEPKPASPQRTRPQSAAVASDHERNPARPPAAETSASAASTAKVTGNSARAAAPPTRAAIAARVRARLEDSLRAHFYYPRIARHRGWEGKVEVGLRVEADGKLSAIRVLRTSGYAVLDRAALTSIGRITDVPEAVPWLRGRAVDMVLPVQYRLVDG